MMKVFGRNIGQCGTSGGCGLGTGCGLQLNVCLTSRVLVHPNTPQYIR